MDVLNPGINTQALQFQHGSQKFPGEVVWSKLAVQFRNFLSFVTERTMW